MAARLYAGKIWKGMNSEMVRDSWGAAAKDQQGDKWKCNQGRMDLQEHLALF